MNNQNKHRLPLKATTKSTREYIKIDMMLNQGTDFFYADD